MCVYVTAMVSKLDESVGHIVQTLMETEMLNNSIIIFISDNGAPSIDNRAPSIDNGAPSIGDFQNWGSNYPLRGVRILVCYKQLTRTELLEPTVAQLGFL